MRKFKTGIITLTVASTLLVGGALANAATPMKEEPMPSKKAELLVKNEVAAAIVTDTFHEVEKKKGKQILMIGIGINAADIVLARDAIILVNGEKSNISSLVAGYPVTVVKNMAGEAFLVIQVIQTTDNSQSTKEGTSQVNPATGSTNSTPTTGTKHIH